MAEDTHRRIAWHCTRCRRYFLRGQEWLHYDRHSSLSLSRQTEAAWEMCNGPAVPLPPDHPLAAVLVAAYALGGHDAIDAMAQDAEHGDQQIRPGTT